MTDDKRPSEEDTRDALASAYADKLFETVAAAFDLAKADNYKRERAKRPGVFSPITPVDALEIAMPAVAILLATMIEAIAGAQATQVIDAMHAEITELGEAGTT